MAAWSLADWSFEPGVLIGLVALVGAYVVAVRNWRPRTLWGEYVVSSGEVASFAAGVLMIVVALISPLDTLSNQMFSAHMLQHMILLYFAPLLILLAIPGWVLSPILDRPRLAGAVRVVSHPISAFLVFNLTLVLWHMTFFWQMALVDPSVHALEHLMFLAAGLVAWWPVFSPLPSLGRLSYPAQCLYLFVQSLVPATIGAVVTFSDQVVYPVYGVTEKLWGMTPLVDQQIAGLEMKILGTLFLWVLVTIRFFQWFHHEEHENEKLLDDGAPDLTR
jgi:putative membrane protein